MNLEFRELMVVAVIALLIYGGRLPELARTLGQWMGKLRRMYNELQDEFQREVNKLDLEGSSSSSS